ncbi:MAG TPA: ABC transporter permease [Gemmatimonadales bacterium]|nr:ABC transporter permease [Gemmatimonadales bacterium]
MTTRIRPGVAAFVGAVYLFLHVPVAVLIAFSFNASRFSAAWSGFTLDWYRHLFERDDLLRATARSLLVGVSATAIATVIGTLLALALARHRIRGRRAVEALLYAPVVTPEVVAGVSLLMLFASVGIPLGLGTIVLAHATFCLPFVVIVVLARLSGMDRSLEEAAMILGADEIATFRRVTLPQLAPGVLAAALLAFTLSIDDFVITSFVAGPGSSTLPMLVYSMVRRNVEPTVNAISAIIVVATTILIVAAERLTHASPDGRE